MDVKNWKKEYTDFRTFVNTQAEMDADKVYTLRQVVYIMLRKDRDPEAYETMLKFFFGLWDEADALIAQFEAAESDHAREAISVDFAGLVTEAKATKE